MDNKITLNIEEILKCDNNSITDIDIIRQIGLITTQFNPNISYETKLKLGRKIKKEYEVFGLYPHAMKSFDINPEKLKK